MKPGKPFGVGLLVIVMLPYFTLVTSCVQPPEPTGNVGGNRNPVIRSLIAEPPSISVGSSSTVTVDAMDPDHDPLTYRWSASTGDIIGEGSSVRFTASFCCAGPNYVKVTVSDNSGGNVSQMVDVFISY
jgi:hypothetical protein